MLALAELQTSLKGNLAVPVWPSHGESTWHACDWLLLFAVTVLVAEHQSLHFMAPTLRSACWRDQ